MLTSPSTLKQNRQEIKRSSELSSWQSAFGFVFLSFCITRFVILIVLQGIAPHLPLSAAVHDLQPFGMEQNFKPQMGWELFTHWDGKWYEDITTNGYTYDAKDLNQLYSIVFLPMYAVVSNFVMRFGLPFEVAGTLVNNVCFFGANYVLYRWVEEFHGVRLARWTVVAMTCFPASMFGMTAYTDGLFMLSTGISLRAFDRGQYALATLSGMVASTTRMFGFALIPTFLIRSWQQRRSISAYLAGLVMPGGLILFLVYCKVVHGDFMATFHAQKPWLWGHANWTTVVTKLFASSGMAADSWMQIITFWGFVVTLWLLRRQLHPTLWMYGMSSIGLLLLASSTDGIVRYVYDVLTFPVALGYVLMKYPKIRIPMIAMFTLIMSVFAIRFVWWSFVA
jgi:hypothetical protein